MKNKLTYIIGGIIALGLIILLMVTNRTHEMDERITLDKSDKIPYGMYVAYNNLKYIFPGASISANRREPGYWDSLSADEDRQLLIVVAAQLNASESEMEKIIRFAQKGNDVFISARYLSDAADNLLKCKSSAYYYDAYTNNQMGDSLLLSLISPLLGKTRQYTYPGKTFGSYISEVDTSTTEVLGITPRNQPDFIHLRTGSGNLYIQTEPLAFSNYFLLYGDNISYYEKIFSLIPGNIKRVVWDEYFLNKRPDNQETPHKSWLSILFRYASLKAAILVAFFTLTLYVLLEMRRKQRYIPIIEKTRNESLDFVKTIGRLYYEKGDHKNLCRKMGAYFLEHVRNRYKLATGMLDEDFIHHLRFKTGVDESVIRGVVSFIKYVEDAPVVNQNDLADFHKQLELFYSQA